MYSKRRISLLLKEIYTPFLCLDLLVEYFPPLRILRPCVQRSSQIWWNLISLNLSCEIRKLPMLTTERSVQCLASTFNGILTLFGYLLPWPSLCKNSYGNIVAREITQAAVQSMHEYVWRVKWDQGERNGRLGRSNSHPPDRESCLTSGLPICWRTYKLPQCTIDLDVVFLYDDVNPAWMHVRAAFSSLRDARRETDLGIGLLENCCRKKGLFQRKNLPVHLLLRRNWLCCIVTYVDSHLHTCTYICRIIHSDTTIKSRKENAGRLLYKYILPSLYL